MYRCYYVANRPDRIHLLMEEGVKDILVSYAYARKGEGYMEGMRTAAKKGCRLLVDSGGHSNIHHPGTVVLKEYVEWLKANKGIAHEYIVLDDPVKRDNTLKALAEMTTAGLKPMAVDHTWFKVDPRIVPWYTKGGRLCWAGFLIGTKTPMGQWAKNEEVTKKMPEGYATQFQTTAQWMTVAKRIHERHGHAMKSPVNLIHLLGVGSKIRKFLPYLDAVDSFDAASVFIAAGYGRVILCREPKHEGMPPRCSGFPVGRGRPTPPEVAKLASKWKLNLDKELDRRRFNIREMRKYHETLWEYYQQNHKKGHDFLTEMSVKKSDEDDDLFPNRPLMVQVSIPIADAWGERLEMDEMELVVKAAQTIRSVSDVTPSSVAKLPDPSLVLLHEEAHLLDHTEVDSLARAHLFIVQEMSKRSLSHDPQAGVGLDLASREMGEELGLDADELETLGLARAKADGSEEPADDDLLQPVMDAKLLPVEKADEDRHVVLGVVLEPNSVDTQGDTISPDEIERASHLWLARFQDRGFMHRQIVNSKIEIYESYLAPVDLTIGGQKVKKGSWLLMYHVTDDALWAAIKRGDLTGFSMGGFARRVKA